MINANNNVHERSGEMDQKEILKRAVIGETTFPEREFLPSVSKITELI
jgi:plasmid stability protein